MWRNPLQYNADDTFLGTVILDMQRDRELARDIDYIDSVIMVAMESQSAAFVVNARRRIMYTSV